MTFSSSIDSSDSSPLESAVITVPWDRVVWLTSVAIAAAIFGSLVNRHWVPGGDSEVYVATARNLVLRHFSFRHGYVFNGQPLNMEPPGWPYVLALAMTISPKFVFLKMVVLVSMVGSLAMAYPICRRFVPPRVAGGAVVLTALLSHVFSLTFWLHSDAIFCLIGTASFLVAIQIGEGRTQGWRIILLCLLCSAAVMVRWAGVLNWIIVAAALMNGRGKPIDVQIFRISYWHQVQSEISQWFGHRTWTRQAIAVVLCSFVTFSTFGFWRIVLHVSAHQAALIRDAGGTEDVGLDSRADAMTHQEYSFFNSPDSGLHGYITRALHWGDWFSFLFWQPFRFHAIKWLNLVSVLAGWLVAIPLLYLVYRSLNQRQWIWPAVVVYAFPLALLWPHPNARYLVPISFLLLISIWAGCTAIAKVWPRSATLLRIAVGLFLFSYILCNGALYGIEVWAQRSHDFYSTYEAGLNKDLIAAGHWLSNHHLPPNEAIACSERYVNLSTSARTSKLGLRVTTMLTGRPIITIPKKYLRLLPTTGPTTGPATAPANGNPVTAAASTDQDFLIDPDPVANPLFLAWARAQNIRYYLYQPPVSPWRALHFRVAWLQERATHLPVKDNKSGWRLYKIPTTGPSAIRVPLPDAGDWPTSVPGL